MARNPEEDSVTTQNTAQTGLPLFEAASRPPPLIVLQEDAVGHCSVVVQVEATSKVAAVVNLCGD
jgi:hypothetical protein